MNDRLTPDEHASDPTDNLDPHTSAGRKMQLLGWRARAIGVPPWEWEIVKLNLSARVLARYGDATWQHDLVVAGLIKNLARS